MPASAPGRRLALYATVAVLARMAGSGLPSAVLLGVLAASGTVAQGSVIIATYTTIAAIMGPLSGAYVDRIERPKRAYVAALSALCVTSALLAIGIGRWSTGVLIPVAMLAGLSFPFVLGAWSAQLRRIAPEVEPSRAYSVDVGTYNLADIAGPAIVGLAFIVDSAVPGASSLEAVTGLFLAALVALLLVRVPARSATHAERPQPFMRSLSALSVMWTSLSLRRVTVISVVGYAAIGCYVVSMPLLGQDLAGDAGYGPLVLSLTACGALVGSILLARRPIRRHGPGTLVVVLSCGMALLYAVMAVAPSLLAAVPVALAIGLVEAPALSGVMQVRDRESTPSSRAMVFSTGSSMKVGAFAVGSLIAGSLAGEGWRVILVVGAAIQVAAVVVGLVLAPPRGRLGSPITTVGADGERPASG